MGMIDRIKLSLWHRPAVKRAAVYASTAAAIGLGAYAYQYGLPNLQVKKVDPTTIVAPVEHMPSVTLSDNPTKLDEGNLLKIVQDGIDQSMLKGINEPNSKSGGFFLIKSGDASNPVYYINSPTQFGQIVSEGMAYSTQILANTILVMKSKNPSDPKIAQYNPVARGLINGALTMLNKYGNMGWRCYYDSEKKTIVFRSQDERASATDADLIFIDALMTFEQLGIFDGEIFKTPASVLEQQKTYKESNERDVRPIPAEFTINQLVDFMIQGAKSYDVERVGQRLVLRVSDNWGGKDFKGNITSNSSYYQPAILARLVGRDIIDANLWWQLRSDEFDKLEATFFFTQKLFKEIDSSKMISEDGKWVRLDSYQFQLFEHLLGKIPISDNELYKASSDNSLDKNKNATTPYLRTNHYFYFNPGISIHINNDGSRDIAIDSYNQIMAKIEGYGVNDFLPDQVEIEVDATGNFVVRREVGAKNLGATSGYDAIRIPAENSIDLLHNNDSSSTSTVPVQFRISGRQFSLINIVVNNQPASTVKADRFHNAVALSSYTTAVAGLSARSSTNGKKASFDLYREETKAYASSPNGIYDYLSAGKHPQYYSAFLTLRYGASLLVRDKNMTPKTSTGVMNSLPRSLPDTDLKFTGVGKSSRFPWILEHENSEYGTRAFQDDPIVRQITGHSADPIMKLEAERRYHDYHKKYMEAKGPDLKKPNVPGLKLSFLYGKACLGVGRYDEAGQVFFTLLRDTKEINGPVDQFMFSISITRLSDILSTLNVSDLAIEDTFKWLLEHQGEPGLKKTMLHLAYVHELNNNRRFTLALKEEKELLNEVVKYASDQGKNGDEKLWEEVQSSILSGNAGHTPLPSRVLLTNALVETIDTIASTYRMESTISLPNGKNDKPVSFPKKVYNYSDAFILAEMIVGQNNAVMQEIRKAKLMQNAISEKGEAASVKSQFDSLAAEVPENLKTLVLLKVGRILQRRIYDMKDDIEARRYYCRECKDYWFNYSQDVEDWDQHQKQLTAEYESMVKASELPEIAFRQAIKEEVLSLGDPPVISALMDGLLETLQYRLELLSTIKNEEYGRFTSITAKRLDNLRIGARAGAKKPSDIMAKNIADMQAAKISFIDRTRPIFDEMDAISSPLLNGFVHPVKVKGEEMLRTGRKGTLEEAVKILVNEEASTDPRNVKWVRWLRAIADAHSNAGTHGQNPKEFEKALEQQIKITDIYISSPPLRALYTMQVCIKMAQIYYNYRDVLFDFYKSYDNNLPEDKNSQEYKESKEQMDLIDAKIVSQSNEMQAILRALLGKKVDATGLEPDTVKMMERINTNRKFIDANFDQDPTQKARLYAHLGNFTWWKEMASQTEREKSPTEQHKAILKKALDYYEEALSYDPYNFDSLFGISKVSFNLYDEQASLQYLIKALDAVGVGYVPEDRRLELKGIINNLAAKNDFQVKEERPLNERQLKAVKDARDFLKDKQEINSYVIARVMDILSYRN
ncbi:MAG: hypothetical protein WC624_03435 [Candidatus Margulisiibacteriota bacterium]